MAPKAGGRVGGEEENQVFLECFFIVLCSVKSCERTQKVKKMSKQFFLEEKINCQS